MTPNPSALATAAAIVRGDVRLVPPTTGRRVATMSGASIGWRGNTLYVSADESDWSAQATVYRCVQLIAANLASVPLTVADGDELDDTDPIAMLYNDGAVAPSGEVASVSARVVREVAFARAELMGQSFVFIDRAGGNPTGTPLGLYPIYDPVEIIADGSPEGILRGRVAGFVVRTRDGRRVPLLPSEVLWLRYPHPTRPLEALAPWRAAMYAAESDAYARRWQQAEFRNNARPSGVVSLGTVTPQVYEAALAELRTRVDGPDNASKTLVTTSAAGGVGASYQRISLSPEEMSYLESRKANADEIFLAFGVSADLFRPGSTFDNRREAKKGLWSETLVGKLDVLASEIDRQLMPDPGRTVVFDLSGVDALRESQDAVIKRASDATYPDIMMIDEARAAIGLEPLPGGAGAYTLTAYRARAQLTAQAEFMSEITAASTPARMIRHNGTFVLRRARPSLEITARKAVDAVGPIEKVYARHERIGKREVAKLAKRQERAVLQALRKLSRFDLTEAERALEVSALYGRDDAGDAHSLALAEIPDGQRVKADDLFDPVYWRAETMKALESFLEGVWVEGGQRLADKLGVSWDHIDPLVLAKMQGRLADLATVVTGTTRQIIEGQILAEGVLDGESISKLADRIKASFEGMATWRAEMIARTETIGGFNAAAQETAEQSGVALGKQWLATRDSRTRDTHRDLDGARVDMAETFPNGCRFPGDPLGSPGETINCRCVLLYEV